MKSFNIINLLIFFISIAVVHAVISIFFLPSWLLLLSLAVLCLIISKFLFKLAWIENLVLCLVLMEISWVLCFMPLGYLTQSAVLLIIFYVVWDIFKNQFKSGFMKIIIGDLIFGGVLLALLLLTNKWMPV